MAEIRTVTTLTKKRDEISRAIGHYEKQLGQARTDLVAINAAIVVFQGPNRATAEPMWTSCEYSDTARLPCYVSIVLKTARSGQPDKWLCM
jgi:hypothetical protein